MSMLGGLGAPPPMVEESGGSPWLGVPADYGVMRQSSQRDPKFAPNFMGPVPSAMEKKSPLYRKGDEYAWRNGRSPAEIAKMQGMLIDAGLIKTGSKFRKGTWDKTTVDAYRQLLEYANYGVMDEQSALAELINSDEVDMTEPEQIEPLVYQLPNRDDVKAVAAQSFKKLLGRNADKGLLDRVADAMEATVKDVQKKNYDAETAAVTGEDTDGEITQIDTPDAGTFINEQVTANAAPKEVRARQYQANFNEFTDLLTQSANETKHW